MLMRYLRWVGMIWVIWAGILSFLFSNSNGSAMIIVNPVDENTGRWAGFNHNYQLMATEDMVQYSQTFATSAPTSTPKPIRFENTPVSQPTITPVPTNIVGKLPSYMMFVTVQPTVDPDMTNRIATVPILMYHYISTPPTLNDKLRVNLSVPPDQLEQQLQFLKRNGFNTISLYDLHKYLVTGAQLPPKPIILTFDDGYRDHYENAFPLLLKYDMVGTFFIITDPVFQNHPAYMTWDMAREMARHGMSIEAHTKSHPDLRNRSVQYLKTQVGESFDAIQTEVGTKPRFFAYPAGQFDSNVMQYLAERDTWGAVTTQWGTRHTIQNSLTWTRLRINNGLTINEFAKMVN
jgi:peptidoglycan/xylan/chitin deacetylase (PgdA/CDA1 family)